MKKRIIRLVAVLSLVGAVAYGAVWCSDHYAETEVYRGPSPGFGLFVRVRSHRDCCYDRHIEVSTESPFVRMEKWSHLSSCISNLRQLDGAKEQAAMELNRADGASLTAKEIDSYIKGGTPAMRCPCDGNRSFTTSYSIEPLGKPPRCKIHPDRHAL